MAALLRIPRSDPERFEIHTEESYSVPGASVFEGEDAEPEAEGADDAAAAAAIEACLASVKPAARRSQIEQQLEGTLPDMAIAVTDSSLQNAFSSAVRPRCRLPDNEQWPTAQAIHGMHSRMDVLKRKRVSCQWLYVHSVGSNIY